jgi:hypothetical protein
MAVSPAVVAQPRRHPAEQSLWAGEYLPETGADLAE